MNNRQIIIYSLLIYVFIGCYIPGLYKALFDYTGIFGNYNEGVVKNLLSSLYIYPFAVFFGFPMALIASLANMVLILILKKINILDRVSKNIFSAIGFGLFLGCIISLIFVYGSLNHPIERLKYDSFVTYSFLPCVISSLSFFYFNYRYTLNKAFNSPSAEMAKSAAL